MPKRTYQHGKRSTHWWTSEISTLRKECLKARRTLQKARSKVDSTICQQLQATRKEAKKTLKLAIKRSKEKSWWNICNEVETDP